MDRIVTHDLYKYKLVFSKEQVVEAEISNRDEDSTIDERDLGKDSLVSSIYYQDPTKGWTLVRNPEIAFTILDSQHLKVAKSYLQVLNPSAEFFSRRKKLSEDKGSKNKKKKKRSDKR